MMGTPLADIFNVLTPGQLNLHGQNPEGGAQKRPHHDQRGLQLRQLLGRPGQFHL